MKTIKCPLCGELNNKHIRSCLAKNIEKDKFNRFKSRKIKKDQILIKLNRSSQELDK